MKKISIIVFGLTLFGCASNKSGMQSSIDKLTTQVSTLTEEKQQLQEKRDKEVELLCAIVGERSSQGLAAYVGNLTFKSNTDNSLFRMDDMEKQCLDMVESFDVLVKDRAGRLLGEKQESTDPLPLEPPAEPQGEEDEKDSEDGKEETPELEKTE